MAHGNPAESVYHSSLKNQSLIAEGVRKAQAGQPQEGRATGMPIDPIDGDTTLRVPLKEPGVCSPFPRPSSFDRSSSTAALVLHSLMAFARVDMQSWHCWYTRFMGTILLLFWQCISKWNVRKEVFYFFSTICQITWKGLMPSFDCH